MIKNTGIHTTLIDYYRDYLNDIPSGLEIAVAIMLRRNGGQLHRDTINRNIRRNFPSLVFKPSLLGQVLNGSGEIRPVGDSTYRGYGRTNQEDDQIWAVLLEKYGRQRFNPYQEDKLNEHFLDQDIEDDVTIAFDSTSEEYTTTDSISVDSSILNDYYLPAIQSYPLLKQSDEIRMAHQIDLFNWLRTLESKKLIRWSTANLDTLSELSSSRRKPKMNERRNEIFFIKRIVRQKQALPTEPWPWWTIYKAILFLKENDSLITTILSRFNLKTDGSLIQIRNVLIHPSIDWIFSEENIDSVAELDRLHQSKEETATAIKNISLNLELLPRDILEILGQHNLQSLTKRFDSPYYLFNIFLTSDITNIPCYDTGVMGNSLKEWFHSIRIRGHEATDNFIHSNLRLATNYALSYSRAIARSSLDALDLIQEGNVGLIRAVGKFNYRLGYKFSTYATWWIRQSITRHIADQARTIRIPVHMIERINKLDIGLKTSDNINTISKKIDMPLNELRNTYTYASKEPISIDANLLAVLDYDDAVDQTSTDLAHASTAQRLLKQFRDVLPNNYDDIIYDYNIDDYSDDSLEVNEEDITIRDALDNVQIEMWHGSAESNPADAASSQLLKELIEGVLETLNIRERRVLQMRFGLEDGRGRTLEEVGREFGVTRERIRQIEAKGLRKLRHPTRSKKLRDFLE